MTANAQHSCNSSTWGTPAIWMQKVHDVMGIDLDPCSTEADNQIVGAWTYYTEQQNGLTRGWQGRVFCNPPGGRGLPKKFFEKLHRHYVNREVSEYIYLAYSLEQLLWIGREFKLPSEARIAIPHKRIQFRGAGKSPTHGNAFIYCGPYPNIFKKVFEGYQDPWRVDVDPMGCLVLSAT